MANKHMRISCASCQILALTVLVASGRLVRPQPLSKLLILPVFKPIFWKHNSTAPNLKHTPHTSHPLSQGPLIWYLGNLALLHMQPTSVWGPISYGKNPSHWEIGVSEQILLSFSWVTSLSTLWCIDFHQKQSFIPFLRSRSHLHLINRSG